MTLSPRSICSPRKASTKSRIGPCSGAHLGFYTALRDPRIAALAMVNLQLFVWTPGRSLMWR